MREKPSFFLFVCFVKTLEEKKENIIIFYGN